MASTFAIKLSKWENKDSFFHEQTRSAPFSFAFTLIFSFYLFSCVIFLFCFKVLSLLFYFFHGERLKTFLFCLYTIILLYFIFSFTINSLLFYVFLLRYYCLSLLLFLPRRRTKQNALLSLLPIFYSLFFSPLKCTLFFNVLLWILSLSNMKINLAPLSCPYNVFPLVFFVITYIFIFLVLCIPLS